MRKCPEGKYYDALQKKCVDMPKSVGGRWWGGSHHHHRQDHSSTGNGNGNGNGNGSNGNGNGGNGGGVSEAIRLHPKTGNIISVNLAWRGNDYNLKMFFPHVKTPSRREVQDQVRKVYPNAKLWNYKVSDYDPGEPLLIGGQNK